MIRTTRWLLALVVVLAACGGGSPTEPIVPFAKTSFLVVSGDNQEGQVNTQLPQAVVVRVEDDLGNPIANQPVSFKPINGGSMFAGFSITDAAGEVRDYWTLGTKAGPQTLEARAVDPTTGEQKVFDVVKATATAGAAAIVNMQNVTITVPIGSQVDLRGYVTIYADANPTPSTWDEGATVTITGAAHYLAWMQVGTASHYIHVIGQ